MKIAIGSDHAGFQLKILLAEHIKGLGHSVEDVGCYDEQPCDYADSAAAVAREVVAGRAAKGIILCGSGVGANMAANKIKGARAGICHDNYSAHQGVEHDDMNVLVLGARIIGSEVAKELVTSFLGAQFSGVDRHIRRLNKVIALENNFGVE